MSGTPVVRRRLAQKMAFMVEDTLHIAQPTEGDLHAFYDELPSISRSPPRVSFNRSSLGAKTGTTAPAPSSASLVDGAVAKPEAAGDRLLVGDTFVDKDEQALASLFGADFAKAVLALPADRWIGPLRSGFGLHLVRVTQVSPPRSLPFEEVRDRLTEEWLRTRQEAARAELVERMVRNTRLSPMPPCAPGWAHSPAVRKSCHEADCDPFGVCRHPLDVPRQSP